MNQTQNQPKEKRKNAVESYFTIHEHYFPQIAYKNLKDVMRFKK